MPNTEFTSVDTRDFGQSSEGVAHRQCQRCRNQFPFLHWVFNTGTREEEAVCLECAAVLSIRRCHFCNATCHFGVDDTTLILLNEVRAFPFAPTAGEVWEFIPHIPNTVVTQCSHLTQRYICSDCVHRSSSHIFYCQESGVVTDRMVLSGGGYIWNHLEMFHHDASGEHYLPPPPRVRYPSSSRSASSAAIIHDWTYKPTPTFYSTKKQYNVYSVDKSRMFFGAELEIDISNHHHPSIIPEYLKHIPEVYVKRDGSIDHGAEIVTHPISFGAWKKAHPLFDALKKMEDELDANGVNNGVHVHISRGAFKGVNNEIKFRTFIDKFMRKYPITYKAIVLREPNHYCGRMAPLSNYLEKEHAVSRHQDRYNALNFCNDKTIELRSFRGTTKPKEILSYIEFCDSAVLFSLAQEQEFLESRELPLLTPYMKFLKKNRRRYSNLVQRIQKENIYRINE